MLATHEIDSFASLPAKVRAPADAWLGVINELRAGNLSRTEAAARLRTSEATVCRKLQSYAAHGWRGLVPNYKGPQQLPAEFIEYLRALVESFQRASRPAFRELYRRWQRREHIPGYAGCPGWPELPAGWSERNLYKHLPSKLELKAMRQGLGRARGDHGPQTFTTRAGLWPLSHIMFDDVTHDNFVHVLTSRQLVRVDELGALDVLSGSRFAWGARPQLKRADGTTDKLKEANMRHLLAHVLYQYGYSARGTTLVVERGTATIREDKIALLYDRTGGLIKTRKGAMTGQEQAIAGWRGKGKGNFRHKSALESLHNLIHNELAALPAQTGKDVDARPEWLDGVLDEADDLLKAHAQLPPWLQGKLKLPTLEFHSEFHPLLIALYDQIEQRTWHDLEGWARCGFISSDYRLTEGSEWISREQFAALPEAAQQVLSLAVRANPALARPRKLSPREVFTAGIAAGRATGEIITPPVGLIAELLYDDLFTERTARDGYFEFQDSEISADVLRFEARITTPDGREAELRDRETYEVVINPFQPRELWVYRGGKQAGAFLGLARRVESACRADDEAIKRQWGRTETRVKDLLAPIRRRHTARLTAEAAARNTHNADVLAEAAGHLTPAQQRAARRLTADGTTLDDLAEMPAPTDPDAGNETETSDAGGLGDLL